MVPGGLFLIVKMQLPTRPQQAEVFSVGVELVTPFLPYLPTRPQRDYQTFASLKSGYFLEGGELLGWSR